MEKEPNLKKLKMSTSTTSDDDDAAACAEKKPRYKRRKIAIFFAYCGVGYQGMQKNPGAKTIEADLEEALFLSGAVPDHDRGHPKRFDWARSARTDKGVSAVGQVVSGRFYIDPPGLADRLNSNLSPQIRIFGYKRVTGSFNAKKFCDRRRYVYLIPVFALDPCSHRDRESVFASLGSEIELVKCLDCSERGRKVAGVLGKRSFESKTDSKVLSNNVSSVSPSETIVEPGILSNDGSALSHAEIKDTTTVSPDNGANKDPNSESLKEISNSTDENDNKVLHQEVAIEEQKAEAEGCELGECNNREVKPLKSREFVYGEKERERFNRILKQYEGTHNFHNFTTRTKAEDPSARRFIVSFNANAIVTVEGIEFIKCEIVGQSFMLHQIRKMIGLAVAVMRNCAAESLIETALQQDVNINVPTAPEVGLYLDECLFTSYNQKWKDSHEELSMKAYAEEAEEFKMKHIYSHIASMEHKEGVVALWLHSLNHRNYPDLRVVNDGGATDLKSSETEHMIE